MDFWCEHKGKVRTFRYPYVYMPDFKNSVTLTIYERHFKGNPIAAYWGTICTKGIEYLYVTTSSDHKMTLIGTWKRARCDGDGFHSGWHYIYSDCSNGKKYSPMGGMENDLIAEWLK